MGPCPPTPTRKQVAQLFSREGLLAILVVAGDGTIKGIITVDDIVHVVQAEATEDVQKAGGLEALDRPAPRAAGRPGARRHPRDDRHPAHCALGRTLFQSYGPHFMMVALTVGLILVAIVMWGTLAGAMLPFLLRRLGLDPTSASAPFVATLVDVSGLVIYFTVAEIVLGGVLL